MSSPQTLDRDIKILTVCAFISALIFLSEVRPSDPTSLLIGVPLLLVAGGFWRRRHWAWKWGMRFSVAGFVAGILSIIGGQPGILLLPILLSALIVYLLRRPHVRSVFQIIAAEKLEAKEQKLVEVQTEPTLEVRPKSRFRPRNLAIAGAILFVMPILLGFTFQPTGGTGVAFAIITLLGFALLITAPIKRFRDRRRALRS